jgi:hypothetical protein
MYIGTVFIVHVVITDSEKNQETAKREVTGNNNPHKGW